MQQLLSAGIDWMREFPALVGPFIGWLKEWQFLVGSLIAIFAAGLAVNAINRHIREQRAELDAWRLRRVRASRAGMPEDLHAICAYARRSADLGREAAQIISADEEGRQRMRQTKLRCPSLPLYVLSNLKALVENLDNNLGEQVADLVKCYYTQHARLVGALENLNRSSVSTITVSKAINLNPVFKDTLELYLRTKGMMQFARGKTENIADVFDTSEVLSALKALNMDPVLSPEAREYCLRFLSNEKANVRL